MLSEFKGHTCQHRSDDFADIAAIIRPHRPEIVVELGTDRGGFSAFLADLVAPWGGVVHTFDREAKFRPELLRDFKNIRFTLADVLVPPAGSDAVSALLLQGKRALLYCDNGDKKREVELYAALLPAQSLLATHDYNTEIMGAWVEPYVAALGFAPEGHARMEALRNEWYPEPMTRLWLRREVRAAGPGPVSGRPDPGVDPVGYEQWVRGQARAVAREGQKVAREEPLEGPKRAPKKSSGKPSSSRKKGRKS